MLNHSSNYFKNIYCLLSDIAKKGTLLTKYNINSVVFFGGIGHPLYYFLHHHLFDQKWKSFTLSMCAGLFCFMLSTQEKWPKKIKFLFPFYWHFVLIFNLPFLITLIAIGNGFVDVWPAWCIAMIFMLIMFVPNVFMFIVDILIGLGGVCIYKLLVPSYGYFDLNSINFTWYLTLVIFTCIAGTSFSYSNLKGIASEERSKIFKSLAGSIAHEMRNPFSAVGLVSENNKDILKQIIANPHSLTSDQLKNLQEVLDNSDVILSATKRGNNIINITLNELTGEKPDPQSFIDVSAVNSVSRAIKEYAYKSNDERHKVIPIFTDKDNFVFKGDENLFIYTIFNLIKNALYYANSFPNCLVTIGFETLTRKKDGNKKYHSIYIHDTGPGIQSEIIPQLFDDFFTSGKKDGTGLGLAFCKRNMLLFGGDIICESRFGGFDKSGNQLSGWTKFSLLFPVVEKKEMSSPAIENISNKKIANSITKESDSVVDFHNLTSTIEASDDTKQHQQISTQFVSNQNHSQPQNSISQIISPQQLETLRGKKLLIADDQELNRKIIKKSLEKYGLIITEVSNGKELVEVYKKNLNNSTNLSSFDIILTDINMPPFDGDDATIEIRKIEAELNKAQQSRSPQRQIPIVALTGNSGKDDINHFFACQMDDYFIKGGDIENLVAIIAKYLEK